MGREAAAWALLAPSLLLFLLFGVGALVMVTTLSFTDSNLMASSFVGLRNYGAALADGQFRRAGLNSLEYAAIIVPVVTVVPMVVALLVYPESARWHDGIRIAFFIPNLASGVITIGVWQLIFHPTRAGLLNQVLGVSQRWFLDGVTGVPAVATVLISYMLGGNLIWYLARLAAVPRELIEAATIDGAGRRQIARHILVPELLPIAGLVALLATIAAPQHAETLILLAPHPWTASLGYSVFREGFVFGQHGYAAAQAVLLIGLVAALSVVYRRLAR